MKSVIDHWRKLFSLSRSEQALLIRASLLLPGIALAMRLIGLRRLQEILSNLSTRNRISIPSNALDQAKQTARIVGLAARYGSYRASCLPQALVLRFLLRQQGIESDLRIGVRKTSDKLEAHAWIEFQGLALNDLADVGLRFAPFISEIRPVEADTK